MEPITPFGDFVDRAVAGTLPSKQTAGIDFIAAENSIPRDSLSCLLQALAGSSSNLNSQLKHQFLRLYLVRLQRTRGKPSRLQNAWLRMDGTEYGVLLAMSQLYVIGNEQVAVMLQYRHRSRQQ